jgi:hypothetical protein
MKLVGRSGLASDLRASETSTRTWQRGGLFKPAAFIDGREMFDLDDPAICALRAQREAAANRRMTAPGSAAGQAAA